jgi:hypothetical protein
MLATKLYNGYKKTLLADCKKSGASLTILKEDPINGPIVHIRDNKTGEILRTLRLVWETNGSNQEEEEIG